MREATSPELRPARAEASRGMAVIRQESELVLKSRWVLPEMLTDAGFEFRWTDIEAAAKRLLR